MRAYYRLGQGVILAFSPRVILPFSGSIAIVVLSMTTPHPSQFARDSLARALVVTGPAASPVWTLRLSHTQERWHEVRIRETTELSATRRLRHLGVAAAVQWIGDEHRSSIGVSGELYTPLWRSSEGYLRVFTAPRAASAPDLLIQAEVMQYFARGWHVSLSGDTRTYDRLDITVLQAGAGWSDDKWFLRARAGGVRTSAKTMAAANMMFRRSSVDRRRHVQLSVSTGGDVFDVADPATSTMPVTANSTAAAFRALVPISANFGISGGVGLADYRNVGIRTHLEAGLTFYSGF